MRRCYTVAMAAMAAAIMVQPAAAADASVLDGPWLGVYVCAQGETYLILDLDGKADGSVTGTFYFGNTNVPEGKYEVAGRLDGQNRVTLRGVRWIKQPSGYVMVDLEGEMSREAGLKVIAGSVVGAPGCTTFRVGQK
ncbi:MAG: hypothetical protein Q8L66_14495 [Caulobacter sp.]|nr:hypothetical protein [Caulobacter sp.]